jgi:hypothetical protein
MKCNYPRALHECEPPDESAQASLDRATEDAIARDMERRAAERIEQDFYRAFVRITGEPS